MVGRSTCTRRASSPGGSVTSGPAALALDIGGTKIAGGLVAADGTVLLRERAGTPAHGSAEEVYGAVEQVVSRLKEHPVWQGVQVAGVGSCGPVHLPGGAVSPVNIPGWQRFPLAARLAETLGGRVPVRLCGDGVAYAAAEHWLGAARGYTNALCMVVSTGIGGGLISGGELLPGPTGNAGHVGHVIVDVDGEPCSCGSVGCVETIASGPALVRWATRRGWQPAGAAISTSDLADDARNGHPAARQAFDRAALALAAAVVSTAALTEVEVAVVGGGVSGAGEVLFDPLATYLDRMATLPFLEGLTAVMGEMSGEAGLVGAARVAFTSLAAGQTGAAAGPETE